MSQYRYTSETQRLANGLPLYAKGRRYKWSNYQQLLNLVADRTDKIETEILKAVKDIDVFAFDGNQLDVLYYKPASDPGGAAENLEEWLSATPTLLIEHSAKTVSNPSDIYAGTPAYDITPASSYLYNQTLQVKLSVNGEPRLFTSPVNVRLCGLMDNGSYVEEEFVFNFPAVFTSKYKWKILIKILTGGVFDDSIALTVGPVVNSIGEGLCDLAYAEYKPEDSESPYHIFWRVTADGFLEKLVPSSLDEFQWENRLSEMELFGYYKLFDASGSPINSAVDFCFSDRGDDLYVLDGVNIHRFSKKDAIPSLVKDPDILKATVSPVVKISYEEHQGAILFKGYYDKVSAAKPIAAYRFRYKTPSAHKYLDLPDYAAQTNSTWKDYTSPSDGWINYTLRNTVGFVSPVARYSTAEEYLNEDVALFIDVRYKDGSVETDAVIVPAQKKTADWSLPHGLTDPAAIGLDRHGVISVLAEGSLRKFFAVDNSAYYDRETMRLVYKHGNIEGETLSVDNYYTRLDDLGAQVGLERLPGEKLIDYADRLSYYLFALKNPSPEGLAMLLALKKGSLPEDLFALKVKESDSIIVMKNPDLPSLVGSAELSSFGASVAYVNPDADGDLSLLISGLKQNFIDNFIELYNADGDKSDPAYYCAIAYSDVRRHVIADTGGLAKIFPNLPYDRKAVYVEPNGWTIDGNATLKTALSFSGDLFAEDRSATFYSIPKYIIGYILPYHFAQTAKGAIAVNNAVAYEEFTSVIETEMPPHWSA